MDGSWSKGLFTAVVIALICVRAQKLFTDRNLVIKAAGQRAVGRLRVFPLSSFPCSFSCWFSG